MLNVLNTNCRLFPMNYLLHKYIKIHNIFINVSDTFRDNVYLLLRNHWIFSFQCEKKYVNIFHFPFQCRYYSHIGIITCIMYIDYENQESAHTINTWFLSNKWNTKIPSPNRFTVIFFFLMYFMYILLRFLRRYCLYHYVIQPWYIPILYIL